MDFKNEEVMRTMARMALEQAMQTIARDARIFADHLPLDMTGKEALIAFADAIESTNKKVWPATSRPAQ